MAVWENMTIFDKSQRQPRVACFHKRNSFRAQNSFNEEKHLGIILPISIRFDIRQTYTFLKTLFLRRNPFLERKWEEVEEGREGERVSSPDNFSAPFSSFSPFHVVVITYFFACSSSSRKRKKWDGGGGY